MVVARLSKAGYLDEDDVELVVEVAAAHEISKAATISLNSDPVAHSRTAIYGRGDACQHLTYIEPRIAAHTVSDALDYLLELTRNQRHHDLAGRMTVRFVGARRIALTLAGRTTTRLTAGRMITVLM